MDEEKPPSSRVLRAINNVRRRLLGDEMSVQFKILGQTPKSGKALCVTCKRAKIIKGQRFEELILCHIFNGSGTTGSRGGVVPFRVAECSEYHPMNRPWLHEMEDMAWIIEARKRGPAGFEASPEDESIMEVVVTKPDKSNMPYDE